MSDLAGETIQIEEKEDTSPSRLGMGQIIALLLAAAFLALMAFGLIRRYQGRVEHGPAPDFTLTTFDGEQITLSNLRGHPVVLNFWASWCQPCKVEAPDLEQAWRDYKDQGVMFIGVDYLDQEHPAKAYLAEFDITYPNGPDIGSKIYRAYRVQGVPETFLISPEGEVVRVKVGPISRAELDQWLQPWLE
ncbi:MAG TPA: TlpA family protein disulfide reductase [Anaerolineae bacterium]|nr:TlpA family protein disulfide reductase [Anaerolineae bacterium]